MNPRYLVLFATLFALGLILYWTESEHWAISPLGTMLGSGVAAACFSQAIMWWKEYSREENNRQRDRQFIALQLAVVLERYSIDCASRIGVLDRNLDDSIQNGSPNFPILGPGPLNLPDAVEWRWLAAELTSEVLSIAPKIDYSIGSINYLLEVTDLHTTADEAIRQLRLIGLEAWKLAEKVRTQNQISSQTYELGEWDFVATLENTGQ